MIPDDLLARSLEEVRQGKGSLEAILARLPDHHRVELEPLLRLALQVERLRDDSTVVAPSGAFRAALRSQLMSATVETAPAVYRNGHTPHAPELEFAPVAPAPIIPFPARRAMFPRRWQQIAAAFAAGALLVAGAGVSGAQAAKDSLPDQPLLYGLKLAQEQVRLTLASEGDERVGVYLQIANTRLQELARATGAGKTDLAYQLSQKYSQTLSDTTSALQNNGPEKNAIMNTEVAGFMAQQVTSLQDLQTKAPGGARDAVAIALSAASRVQGDLAAVQGAAPGMITTPSAPEAGTTAVVSDPPPPLPSATITVPEPVSSPAHDITITGGGSSSGSVPTREQVGPGATSGSLNPPADKGGTASGQSPEKGLAGAVPAPQPIPPRTGDAPSVPGPVAAQPGSEPPSITVTVDPTPAPAPVETPSDSGSAPSQPSGPTPPPSDKPPVISTPPDGGSGTPVPTPDDGKGSGGLTPAPTPTPSKGLTVPDGSGDKGRVLPSVRPAFEVEVSAQPPTRAPILITGALVAPDDGLGRQ